MYPNSLTIQEHFYYMEPTATPAAASMAASTPTRDDELLQISTHDADASGIPLVAATGDVDLCTAPLLRQALVSAFAQPAPSGTIALDMRDVGFIDSAGLALLVEIRKMFYDKTKLALLVQKGSQPERVLKLGRFDTFLQVAYQSEELATLASAA